MFKMKSIDVPILGIIENMSYFSPIDFPNNKYYIFGKEGAKELAKEMNVRLLAEIPIIQSVREAADIGRPVVMQKSTQIAKSFINLSKNVISSLNKGNNNPTKAVRITHKKGCSK